MSKQEILQAIKELPEDVSIDDIMYRLYVLRKHQNAMDDIKTENVFAPAQARESIISP